MDEPKTHQRREPGSPSGVRSKVLEAERAVGHLHEIELAGESEYTPVIAIGGLVTLLAAVFALVLAVSLVAYYLAT
jgi:hypothetical protein